MSGAGVAALCEELVMTMQPAPVGVSVKGQQVVKVAPGSQAELLGIQIGWLITVIAGLQMPEGATGTKAISEALAAGRKRGKAYEILFRVAAEDKAAALQQFNLEVEPSALGVSVKGREVTKVAPNSQAEKAGVQVGWLVFNVNGTTIPDGAAGTKAVSQALAAGRKRGKPFGVIFLVPVPAAAAEQDGASAEEVQYDATIAKAIRTSKAGGTVRIKSGVYHIKDTLKICTPICLCGEEHEAVTIIYTGAGSAIEYSAQAEAEAKLRWLSVHCTKAKRTGDDVAISVIHGNLAIQHCLVEHPAGYGVSVQGKDTQVVIDSGAVSNCGFSGVTVARGAQVTLQGGVRLCGNREFGLIVASRGTSVVVAAADVSENSEQGLCVWKGGMLTVTGDTTVRDNKGNGILAMDVNTTLHVDGPGVLVARNAKHGVMVEVDATAVLRNGSRMQDNMQDGVIVTTKASGTLTGISAQGNAWAGVRVTFEAEAGVHGCELLGNEKCDLVHEFSAKLQASTNQLETFKSFLEGSNRIFPKASIQGCDSGGI